MSDAPNPFRDNPFVDAHAINALTDACRALNMTLVRAEERHRAEARDLLVVLQRIATHTENLPALVELMTARTNGHSHHQETQDDRDA